ncbi:MAG TPA: hypothetical protein VFK69_13160 [Candidatus Eisenbacteria bacterium]|nr:hypothetical protein [Candidatus Eisenbacteria bacterium]
MSYVPSSAKQDLWALLAMGVATIAGVEWIWRRMHPPAQDDAALAGGDVIAIDRAGDPFPNGDHPEPPPVD